MFGLFKKKPLTADQLYKKIRKSKDIYYETHLELTHDIRDTTFSDANIVKDVNSFRQHMISLGVVDIDSSHFHGEFYLRSGFDKYDFVPEYAKHILCSKIILWIKAYIENANDPFINNSGEDSYFDHRALKHIWLANETFFGYLLPHYFAEKVYDEIYCQILNDPKESDRIHLAIADIFNDRFFYNRLNKEGHDYLINLFDGIFKLHSLTLSKVYIGHG